MAVTENDTDLRWSGTLTSELGDLVDDLVGGGLQPCTATARAFRPLPFPSAVLPRHG